MRSVLALLFLPASALFSQSAATRAQVQNGIQNQRTMALHSLSEPNAVDEQAGTVPWKTLANEQGDDPTLSAVAPQHDAPKAARKAAIRAEKISKKGDHTEAISAFQEALSIDPQYYEAANNLALEWEAVGKNAEAEKTLRTLTESAPAHMLAWANLAALLCHERRYSEAETVARAAMEKHRYSFKANFFLGTAMVDQGHWTDEAKLALQYAQVKYPEVNDVLNRWPARETAK